MVVWCGFVLEIRSGVKFFGGLGKSAEEVIYKDIIECVKGSPKLSIVANFGTHST
jgi:hypothetical protein